MRKKRTIDTRTLREIHADNDKRRKLAQQDKAEPKPEPKSRRRKTTVYSFTQLAAEFGQDKARELLTLNGGGLVQLLDEGGK